LELDANNKPDPATQRALIDGGTEGLKGQVRVIITFKTGCFRCSMSSLPPPTGYPMYTVRDTPIIPGTASIMPLISLESRLLERNPSIRTDMKWIYEKALSRELTSGVTYQLTMGVVKNIIPVIASTNALKSAACVNEPIKVATGCDYIHENYMMYMV
jgi:NEDD8-activating enzyme E1